MLSAFLDMEFLTYVNADENTITLTKVGGSHLYDSVVFHTAEALINHLLYFWLLPTENIYKYQCTQLAVI
jgi:hypothetical protein